MDSFTLQVAAYHRWHQQKPQETPKFHRSRHGENYVENPRGGSREGSRPQLRQWMDDFAAIVGNNLTWNLLKLWLNKAVSHVIMKNKSKFASNYR